MGITRAYVGFLAETDFSERYAISNKRDDQESVTAVCR